MDTMRIGEMNARFVRNFLQTERIPLVAQRLGGEHAVHLYFHTGTGKAIVRTVDGSSLPKIVHDEAEYWQSRKIESAIRGEVTLFSLPRLEPPTETTQRKLLESK
jgi:chemotaxis protein CheD